MKTYLSIACIAVITLVGAVRAQQEGQAGGAPAPTFDAKAAASGLTEQQQEQAQANLDEAVQIYSDILDYQTEGQLEAAQRNLEFIKDRLARAVREREAKQNELNALKETSVRQYEALKLRNLPQETKDRRLRELHTEFKNREDMVQFTLDGLTRQIQRLEIRRAELEDQIAALKPEGTSGERFDPDSAEDWQELDAQRAAEIQAEMERRKREQQLRRAEQYQ